MVGNESGGIKRRGLVKAGGIPISMPTFMLLMPYTLTHYNTKLTSSTHSPLSSLSFDPSMEDDERHGNAPNDRFLPIANVGRIMKKAVPANGKISKDAKETVQECVSEFISFVTGEASDKCQREKRKTINGDDILWAITTLGFEDYVNPLKLYLNKYRELEGLLFLPHQYNGGSLYSPKTFGIALKDSSRDALRICGLHAAI
nr:nuclear transcription factor Y subunit B-7-like [Ipomoea trifida]